MKRALVAIGDFENGKKLLDRTIEFFQDWINSIHLVSVIDLEDVERISSFKKLLEEEIIAQQKKECDNILDKLVAAFNDTNITITCESKEGLISEVIVATSKEKKVDLIIMGTKRESLAKRLLKNNVRFVVELSDTPVLLFPI
ncbi:MAG: universal stress protein [Candidatus Heimdallarchaeaceae archaeon]